MPSASARRALHREPHSPASGVLCVTLQGRAVVPAVPRRKPRAGRDLAQRGGQRPRGGRRGGHRGAVGVHHGLVHCLGRPHPSDSRGQQVTSQRPLLWPPHDRSSRLRAHAAWRCRGTTNELKSGRTVAKPRHFTVCHVFHRPFFQAGRRLGAPPPACAASPARRCAHTLSHAPALHPRAQARRPMTHAAWTQVRTDTNTSSNACLHPNTCRECTPTGYGGSACLSRQRYC